MTLIRKVRLTKHSEQSGVEDGKIAVEIEKYRKKCCW